MIVGTGVADDAEATYRGFRRDARGRFTTIDLPGAAATSLIDINDRNQLVGSYENIDATPSPQPTGRMPMGRMA